LINNRVAEKIHVFRVFVEEASKAYIVYPGKRGLL